MNTSTNVVRLRQPEEFEDPLTDILRSGARRLLAQAVELEAEAFLARCRISSCLTGVIVWFGTGTVPSG